MILQTRPSEGLFAERTADREKQLFAEEESSATSSIRILLDSNGFPLVPQPSRFMDDPLVSLSLCLFPFSSSFILFVLILLLAFLE